MVQDLFVNMIINTDLPILFMLIQYWLEILPIRDIFLCGRSYCVWYNRPMSDAHCKHTTREFPDAYCKNTLGNFKICVGGTL